MGFFKSLGPKWNHSTNSFLTLILAFSFLSAVQAQYFVVDLPSESASWANGSPYPFTWTKGLLDGVDSFDVEITRLYEDGLFLVARGVPASPNTLNILLQDVPTGDDYFVICLNSITSNIYSVSSRFSVVNSTASQNPGPNPSVPTVTISGTPNPLQSFVLTLGVSTSGGTGLSPNPSALGFGGILVFCAVLLGGFMTLW